jgi:hypothetical protein
MQLRQEAALLRAADSALRRGDGVLALRLLTEQEIRFPTGGLHPEMVAERVFALCLLGRKEQARAATDEFLQMMPTGPLAARVRGSCGGPAR